MAQAALKPEAVAEEVPVIELRNVSKTFGEVRSLNGINFKVMPGEIVGLLRQWRRQVDAGQDRDGLPQARRRR